MGLNAQARSLLSIAEEHMREGMKPGATILGSTPSFDMMAVGKAATSIHLLADVLAKKAEHRRLALDAAVRSTQPSGASAEHVLSKARQFADYLDGDEEEES